MNGRIVHEKRSKDGEDEFDMVLGDRFIVSAKSSEMEVDQLKAAVNTLDLRRIGRNERRWRPEPMIRWVRDV